VGGSYSSGSCCQLCGRVKGGPCLRLLLAQECLITVLQVRQSLACAPLLPHSTSAAAAAACFCRCIHCCVVLPTGGTSALLPPAGVWQQAAALQQDYAALLPFLFPEGLEDTGKQAASLS
jgi:hypothetical protein